MVPPRNRMTSRGIDQTTSSTRPEYTTPSLRVARALSARNHQATVIVGRMVGTTTASMTATELNRISRFAAATGPAGCKTDELSTIGIADASMQQEMRETDLCTETSNARAGLRDTPAFHRERPLPSHGCTSEVMP